MTSGALKIMPEESYMRLANVLLVDDREADVEYARIALISTVELECNLLIAYSAAEALSIIRHQHANSTDIDLMLLDINMPGTDGFELLELMRGNDEFKHITVVMCTGSKYEPDRRRAMELGAVGYMEKPPFFKQLEPIIETVDNLRILPRTGGGQTLLRVG